MNSVCNILRDGVAIKDQLHGLSIGRQIASDSTSNIDELFGLLDQKYFQGKLKTNGVSLEWSHKVESNIAGYCYELEDEIKGSTRCYIVLNKPLLILRPRIDVVETLLHEMIHAILKTEGIDEGNGGHGPKFKKIMNSINKLAGTNITVTHGFYNETNHCNVLANITKTTRKSKPIVAKPVVAKENPIWKRIPTLPTVQVPEGKPRMKSTSDALVPPKYPAMPRYASPQPPRCPATKYPAAPRKACPEAIMKEIFELHKFKDETMRINLVGYDNDEYSDYSDYSDSDDYSDESDYGELERGAYHTYYKYCSVWDRK